MKCKLGDKYRDQITGFTGTATARAEYIDDSPSVRLTAETGQGELSERWVNEARLLPAEQSRTGFGNSP